MLDFRRTHRTRNHLSQREQRRMLGLLVISVLVLLAVRQAGKPGTWRWIFPSAEANPAEEAQPTRRERHPANLNGELMAGAFYSPAEPALEAADEAGYFPGVRIDYLKAVRDDTFLRHSEQDAWFHLLELLDKSDETALERASTGRVSYVQLDDQPKQYRGRLITIRGKVRQAELVTAPANAYGIGEYYKLVLQPEHGPAEPLIIFSLKVPDGFPVEPKLAADVEVTGFFYKRLAYQAQDRPRIAPLILARTLRWEKPLSKPLAAPPDLAASAPYLLAGVLLASVFCVGYYVRARRRAAELRARRVPSLSPVALESLQNADLSPTTEQALKDLGRQDP